MQNKVVLLLYKTKSMNPKELNEQLPDELKISQIAVSFCWKERSMQYGSNLTTLFIGNVKVASFSYNTLVAKGQELNYVVQTDFNFLRKKEEVFSFKTEEECAEKCLELGKRFLNFIQGKY
jgi:hypothetical protein